MLNVSSSPLSLTKYRIAPNDAKTNENPALDRDSECKVEKTSGAWRLEITAVLHLLLIGRHFCTGSASSALCFSTFLFCFYTSHQHTRVTTGKILSHFTYYVCTRTNCRYWLWYVRYWTIQAGTDYIGSNSFLTDTFLYPWIRFRSEKGRRSSLSTETKLTQGNTCW